MIKSMAWSCNVAYGIGMCFVLFFFVGCSHSLTTAGSSTDGDTTMVYSDTDDKIIVLLFDVFRTTHGMDSIIMTSQEVLPGYLKRDISEVSPPIPPGKWRCTFLNRNEKPMKGIIIDDPLNLEMELPPLSENEDAHVNTEMKLDKGAFILRTRYDKDLNYLLIEKADNAQTPKYIIKLKLFI